MLRKTLLLLAVAALLTMPAVAQDPSLEEILTGYYETIGGLEAWAEIDAAKFTGTMKMNNGQIEAGGGALNYS